MKENAKNIAQNIQLPAQKITRKLYHKEENFATSCVDTGIIKLLKLFTLFERNVRHGEDGYGDALCEGKGE